MSDQCKHCVNRGKTLDCMATSCSLLESWIVNHLVWFVYCSVGNLEKAEAERDRLREALDRIANATNNAIRYRTIDGPYDTLHEIYAIVREALARHKEEEG